MWVVFVAGLLVGAVGHELGHWHRLNRQRAEALRFHDQAAELLGKATELLTRAGDRYDCAVRETDRHTRAVRHVIDLTARATGKVVDL